MSEQKPRKPQPGRAYTGKTIAQPTAKRDVQHQQDSPRQQKKQRVYDNPPPSQRREHAGQAGRHQAQPRAAHAERSPVRQASPSKNARRSAAPAQAASAHPRLPLKRRMGRWVRRGLLVVLVLLVIILGVVWQQAHAVADSVVVPEARGNPSLATPLVGGVNVLLIGVDERPDHPEEGVRSDTLILARMSGAGGWVNLLSIPRDTQVTIPGVGETKINVAYGEGYARAEELFGPGTSPQQGGMGLAAQTVENFLNLHQRGQRVDYTAQINFEGFVGVIDALGGVTIDVPQRIVDNLYPTPDFGTTQVVFEPGPQRMDGATALIYARTRHADSDFGRAQRQQQVLRAIVDELQARGWSGRLNALPQILNGLQGPEGSAAPVLTTMPFDRPDMLLGLALFASGLDTDSIGQVRISPEFVGFTEIGSNIVWDQAGVQAQVTRWMQPPQPDSPQIAPGQS